MDGPRDYCMKSDKDKCHMISLTCGIEKKIQINFCCKMKTDSQAQKRNLQLPKGKAVGWQGEG